MNLTPRNPRNPRKFLAPPDRKRRLILKTYLLLVALSFVIQFFYPERDKVGEDDLSAQVKEQTAEGQADGDNKVTIHYSEHGEKNQPVLMMFHGAPGDSGQLEELAKKLGEKFRVINVDLPGFGKSSRMVGNYSNRAHARYMIALMDHLKIENANLFGYSMGAGVAYWINEFARERVNSIGVYGGMGIVESAGSGDHTFEMIKYYLGYGVGVVGAEFVPHFGLFGDRGWRHALMRNFIDTDRRPMREVIEHVGKPLLILHGRDDPLVPAWAAEEHHDLVEHSELVIFDASHFMVFSENGIQELVDELVPFYERHAKEGVAGIRRTVDHTKDRAPPPPLPGGLNFERTNRPFVATAVIALGTFASEDLTCIASGLLVRRGQLDFFVALMGCFIGIYFGDLGLYLIGRLAGRQTLRWKWVTRKLTSKRVQEFEDWIENHGFKAVIASRFLPGTRSMMYLAAGFGRMNFMQFALWSFLAVAVWTPLLIVLVYVFGQEIVGPLEMFFGHGWLGLIIALILLFVLVRIGIMLTTKRGRQRLIAKVSMLWRWEFWPTWLFYIPLYPYVGLLMLRHKGFATVTAVNPGIEHSGVVGESKARILSNLPEEWIVPFRCVEKSDDVETRVRALAAIIEETGWEYPLILKPNEGQRGISIKRIRSLDDGRDFLEKQHAMTLVQPYHPGPYEAGIFYYRYPHEEKGRIYAVTDKRLCTISGNGQSTLEDLIWGHSRFRMQADMLLRRHHEHAHRVLADGEVFPLVVAANHSQGALFLDGGHLITPELEAAVDQISQQFDGFYFGRYDVRYETEEDLKAGRNFKIIELNGVTSEATNMYDASRGILRGYRILFGQWTIAFRIGSMNRRNGAKITTAWELLKIARRYYRERSTEVVTD